MSLNMTLTEYSDYLDAYRKRKTHEIFDRTEDGSYQRGIIAEYNNKYSLIDRLFNSYPETEYIKLCKKSLSNNHRESWDAKDVLRKPMLKNLSIEIKNMEKDYEASYMLEIGKCAENYDKKLVEKIVNHCYEKLEKQFIENINSNFSTNYVTVTETAILFACDSEGVHILLNSVGLNYLEDAFKQAGLATAILKEVKERYKIKYDKNPKIVMSSENCVNPKAVLDSIYLREGFYRQGSIYITMALDMSPDRTNRLSVYT